MRKQVGLRRLVFIAFSIIAVALDTDIYTDIVILGFHNLSSGKPGASTLPPWGPFCQSGDALGDHGSSRKDTQGSGTILFSDFGVILGSHFESLLGLDG